MSGFTSSALSLLLGWLRSMIGNLWLLLGSDRGGFFVSFFRTHWMTIFVAFCIGGFVIDRIIYFFRWRPDYVWATKWGRMKHKLRGGKAPQVADYAAYEPEDMHPSSYYAPYPNENSYPESPPQNNDPFSPPVYDDGSAAWASPIADHTRITNSPLYHQSPMLPVDSLEEPFENPGESLLPDFGVSKPEPAQYLHDIQSGFAPPPSPETLYPPVETAQGEPVHPGLDLETFQQNIGLSAREEPDSEEPESKYEEDALLKPASGFVSSSFVPFSQNVGLENSQRARNPLSNFAKKARNLVSIDDEDNPPSIRDLHSTVNVRDAFHAPVFPHKPGEENEDE